MKQIIGDLDHFAIEYEFFTTDPILENIKVWISGNYIGFDKNEGVQGLTRGTLINIFNRRSTIANDHLFVAKDGFVFEKLFNSTDIEDDKYIAGFGDRFDDFYVYVVYSDKKFKFIWKLADSPYFEYENYPNKILSGIIEEEYYKKVIDEYENKVSNLAV